MPTPEPSPERLVACVRAGKRHRDRAIAAAARAYVRDRHLPRLLRLTPEELTDISRQGRRTLVARLLRLAHNAARAGAGGHWSYDSNRHIAILGALHAERAGLAALMRAEDPKAETPCDASVEINT